MNHSSLHHIAPYIGRMRPALGRDLVAGFSSRGDLIVDPFCGSGVVGLEATIAGRRAVLGDVNPYAVLLSRAKLHPPRSLEGAQKRLARLWNQSRPLLENQDLRRVPRWVRAFFHPNTLRSALALRDAMVQSGDTFLLACLLGILHHQRPGFLSYPASNLVPYLRTRSFPREHNPDLFSERAVLPRMEAKIQRIYRSALIPASNLGRVLTVDARSFPRLRQIDAIVTSPPYMNGLDYVRDNRLRLWFLQRSVPTKLELPRANPKRIFAELLTTVASRLGSQLRWKGHFILVLGDVSRWGTRLDAAKVATDIFKSHDNLRHLRLIHRESDSIPDVRRARRHKSGTKRETTLIFQYK